MTFDASKRRGSPTIPLGLTIAAVVLAGGAFGMGGWIYRLNRPTGIAPVELTVEKGMRVSQISDMLYRERIIRSPKLLAGFAFAKGTSRHLKAGVHAFHGGMSTWQALKELEISRDAFVEVTVKEGLRREAAVKLLAEALDLDAEKLLRLTSDPPFCRKVGVDAESLEGYLFPETYRFSVEMEEAGVIEMMVKRFFKVFDTNRASRARELGLTLHEVVTLASIIEGEAQLDRERPLISAVYHNRLKRDMPLQADPTVQYAIPDGPRRLFYKDYQVDSPYNTYRHRGLPPGPILSPGEASLKSALWPADVAHLYFVARGDGLHLFSRTNEEHERAKRRTRSARSRTWKRSAAR